MQISKPLVTIYIPSRNYGIYLTEAIESVINQVYTNWELIIIDESSEDDSLYIANSFQENYPDKISVIVNSAPIGLQKIANKVLGIAKGKYMIRLDADDWLDESAILLLVNKLELNTNAGMVYGNFYYTDQSGKVLDVEFRHRLGEENQAAQIPPHGACTLFRVRALKSAGGYTESINAQDGWELWYKLVDRIGAVNIQAPIFYYRQHIKSMSTDNSRLLNARSKIFEKIAEKLEGDYKPTVVGVIPVRESYPNFEGVPFQKINNDVTLLEHVVNKALKSKKIDALFVSSESESVISFSEKLEKDGKVPKHIRIKRKPHKSKGIPIQSFLKQAGEKYFADNGIYPDIMMYLSLHAVNRDSEHLDNAINIIRITESDSIVSVLEEREPMFNYSQNGLELINPGRFQDLTFDKERLYKFNGSIIAVWWEILESNNLFGEKISYLEMTQEDSLQLTSQPMLDKFKK